MPPRRKKTIGPKYAETVHWGPRPGDDTRGGRWVLEDDSYIVPDPPPPPPEPTMPELLERAGARVGGADDDGEVEVARFHLRRVCELHVHGTHTVGESNDISHLPATIRLTRAVEDEVNDDAQPPTHAALYITSEMEVARWRIADPANAVARSGDALIVTVEGVDHVSTNVDWMPSPARAFVLRFLYDDDLERCRAALASPSADAADPSRATVPKPPKRARPDGSRKQNPDAPTAFNTNAFDAKTDSASAVEYFRYYGLIPQQQNMLQDAVRTGTYFTAILENACDFKDKVVMDVGAGSGILSFFAAMAGARRVYAVEASAMSEHCAKLLEGNPRLRDVIVIVNGKVEEVEIPEKVDVMVSEPMGTLLYNERMIESYLLARDRFMRREESCGEGGSSDFGSGGAGLSLRGKMFPGGGRVHCAPFADETLWNEIKDKAHFWGTEDFYGVDLTPLREEAVRSYFRQCVVDAFETELLLSQPVSFAWDWTTLRADELESLDMHLEFKVQRAGPVHGVACWFDVLFEGTAKSRWLTTAPGLPTTHWYQMRLVFERPMRCEAGETVKGRMKMTALDNQSYAVTVELKGKGGKAVSGEWDLKDPYYRQTIYPQPGYTKEQLARFYGEPPA